MKREDVQSGTGNTELQRIRRVSFILLLATLGTYLIVGIISLFVRDWKTVWTICGAIALLAVPFFLLRNGQLRAGNFVEQAHREIEERKKMEDSLRQSHLLLNQISKMAHVGGLVSDRKSAGLEWTEEMYTIHEVDPSSFQPTLDKALDFFDPVSKPVMAKAIQRMRQSGEPFDLELAIITAKGNHRWVRAIGQVDRASGRGYGTLQDITGPKQAEQALRDSNDLISQFLLHSPIYAYIKEVTPTRSRVLQASENYRDMVGIPGHEMIGKTMEDLFPPEFAAKMTADDWAVVSGGSSLEIDEELNGRQYTSIKFPISRQGRNFLAGYTIDVTERKKAEEALRVSEAKFRALVENSNDGILFSSAEGRIRYRSPSYRRINGFADDERLGHSGFETVHPEDLEIVRRYWAKVVENPRTSFKAEYRIRHKDGHWIWIEASGLNLLDNADVQSIVTVSRDITEHRQAEDALRASEERFRKMFERHSAAMMVIEPETGRIIDANEAAAAFYGWPISELKQKSIQQINTLPPESLRAETKRAMASEAVRFDFSHRRADGSVRDVQVYTSKIEFEGKAVLYSVIHDVTERKKAEKELAERESRLSALFDNAAYPISLAKRDRHVVGNPAFLKLYGYKDASELIDRPVVECIAAAERSRVGKFMADRAVGLEAPMHYETTGLRTDGSTFDLEIMISTYVYDKETYTVGFHRDKSSQKRAEEEKARLQEQLIQAHKMESVGRLAGGVAHDFNNMLGVILGHTEIALRQVEPDQPLHDNLEAIRKATVRSADLTRQLLAFARRQTVAPRVLDLNETVQEMLQMLQRLIGEEIDLEWRPQADLWPVRIDPSQIDQMLANLCVNARDAIGGVGAINIEMGNCSFDREFCMSHPGSAPGEYVLLGVSDNGCGMEKETISHLFEPFFTTKPVGKGTGLGLATVYGTVKQNGGFIDVQSEPGHGTSFRIYLPRHAGETERAKSGGTTAPLRGGQETILIVEDEETILELTAMVLKKHGYKVLAARTPDEGLRLAREHATEIHLLMTDVVMPGMNGRQLAQNMLSLFPRIRTLFMSGYTADIISDHGVLDRGVNFIHKPFSIAELSNKIRETLA